MLADYIRQLYSALDRKRPYVTYNRDADHARIVATAGFQYAKEEICLLSHRRDPSVYGGSVLSDAVNSFLDRSATRLMVLVEGEIRPDHPLIMACSKRSSAEVRRVPDSIQRLYECNFMLMDDFGYRYEADRKEYFASVSFHEEGNDSSIKTLKQLFGLLFARSKPE